MADNIEVSTRKFVRDFPRIKSLAKTGKQIRVIEGRDVFVFRVERDAKGFLGCTKGSLVHQAKAESLYSTGERWEADK